MTALRMSPCFTRSKSWQQRLRSIPGRVRPKENRIGICGENRVGGKNRRGIELTSIKDNVMHFDTTDYAKPDGSCCPSIKGTTTFTLAGRKLIEKRR